VAEGGWPRESLKICVDGLFFLLRGRENFAEERGRSVKRAKNRSQWGVSAFPFVFSNEGGAAGSSREGLDLGYIYVSLPHFFCFKIPPVSLFIWLSVYLYINQYTCYSRKYYKNNYRNYLL
jgi:hypothetical protein